MMQIISCKTYLKKLKAKFKIHFLSHLISVVFVCDYTVQKKLLLKLSKSILKYLFSFFIVRPMLGCRNTVVSKLDMVPDRADLIIY